MKDDSEPYGTFPGGSYETPANEHFMETVGVEPTSAVA